MHGVDPSLIIMFRMPRADYIVAILIELQVKSDGIVWTTSKTVVLWMSEPRVDDFLHSIQFGFLHLLSFMICNNDFVPRKIHFEEMGDADGPTHGIL